MKKQMQIYLNNNGELIIIDSSNKKIIKDFSINRYLTNFANDKILNLYEDKILHTITIEYNDYVVEIYDCFKTLSLHKLQFVLKNIQKFKENISIRNINHRKIVRKNKYSGKTIIVSGLVASMILSTIQFNITEKDFKKTSNLDNLAIIPSSYTGIDTTKDNETDNIIESNFKSKTSENSNPTSPIIKNRYIEKTDATEVTDASEQTNSSETNEIVEQTDPVEATEIQEEADSTENSQKTEDISKTTLDEPTSVSLDYDDYSYQDIVSNTKLNYGALIEKYSKMYGIDPKIMLSIAIVESGGVHNPIKNSGGSTGLMELFNSVLENQTIYAYNFDSNSNESLYVDAQKLSDVEYNIKIACMIIQDHLKHFDYNIFMAIQAYNMGGGSLDKILRTCSSYTNQSTDEIKQNTNNLDWLDYRYVIDRGNKYVEKVLSWIGSNIDITCIKTNGERVTINVNNEINKVY